MLEPYKYFGIKVLYAISIMIFTSKYDGMLFYAFLRGKGFFVYSYTRSFQIAFMAPYCTIFRKTQFQKYFALKNIFS